MPASPMLNHPLPSTALHRRRYHYLSFRIEGADPEAIAEEANRRAGQGYALFSTIAIPRPSSGTVDVILVFARRLRGVRRDASASAIEGMPPTDDNGKPIRTAGEGGSP